MRAEKAQEKKEPIYQAPSREATEAMAPKQLGNGGVAGIKNGGATACTERRGSGTKHQQLRVLGGCI
jgi:hypothetical protein